MKIRLGYVAMSLNLEDCSPSGTVTYTAYKKLPDDKTRLYKLQKVANKNLLNTLRILRYNKALEIYVYRLTSKLIPLATHPDMQLWRYSDDFAESLRDIGIYIRENHLRVSAHPDHYTLINSPVHKVLEDSIRDLEYHVQLFEAMGLNESKYKLVLHVGGVYGNKKDSVKRFCHNFASLPDRIRKRLVIENDDKSYNTYDVLELCQKLNIPMVLDVHHHNCICSEGNLEKVLPDIFNTWKNESYPPKIHFSSPKSRKDYRSHADYIDYKEFINFLEAAAKVNRDFDIMLEAKKRIPLCLSFRMNWLQLQVSNVSIIANFYCSSLTSPKTVLSIVAPPAQAEQ